MFVKHTQLTRNIIINTIIILTALVLHSNLNAQQSDRAWIDSTLKSIPFLENLKINGFMQAQFMSASKDGMESLVGDLPSETHNIFKLRRGRLRLEYNAGIAKYVVQFNGTESMFQVLDAYAEVKEPWLKMFSLRGGIFKPNMDQELLYGSDLRYGNEAARVVQKFFPTEYDMGAQLMIKHPKVPVSFTAGILNGTTLAAENDNRKNFTLRLLFDDWLINNRQNAFRLLVGAAIYQGGVYQATSNVYTMDGNIFVLNNDPANRGEQGVRNYYVGELTLEYRSPIGRTWFNGEFWAGEQTATANSVSSPGLARPIGDSYIRPFQSMFGLIAHEIKGTNTALAVKFDHFDPNTSVSGDEIGAANSHTGIADITYTTLSYGIIFTPTNHLRFSLWYDMTSNETSANVTGYTENKKQNLITLRMQVRF